MMFTFKKVLLLKLLYNIVKSFVMVDCLQYVLLPTQFSFVCVDAWAWVQDCQLGSVYASKLRLAACICRSIYYF